MLITYIRFCFRTRKAFCLTIFWREKQILMTRHRKHIYESQRRNLPYHQTYIFTFSLLQSSRHSGSWIALYLPSTVFKPQLFAPLSLHPMSQCTGLHHLFLVHILSPPFIHQCLFCKSSPQGNSKLGHPTIHLNSTCPNFSTCSSLGNY